MKIPNFLSEDEKDMESENLDEMTVVIDEVGKVSMESVFPRFNRSILSKWVKDLIKNDPKEASKLFEIPYGRLIELKLKKSIHLRNWEKAFQSTGISR